MNTNQMATRVFQIIILLALMSCQKSLETSVKGRVLTYGTNDKAANKELNVNLYAETGGSGIFDPGETLVE
ncbi:MAG: hypothetical protein EA358_10575 [Flavobacteriales bacterium]|nr:MAG: hypothetical protein EA358_10575 [Flavobacteriales bacterium]